MSFQWTLTAGYLMALAMENLIDLAAKQMFDDEADRARDAWVAPDNPQARQAAQLEVDAVTPRT
ncbi:hypothetical protein B0E42_20440 [Pseudomonas sp. A25(2017)]|uniref:hypothetical protein n=1 Tax=Pseudomonas sp. A25(2017) TaxID=1945865 RepID=UPI000986CDC6|nr:hypothetical protein [Pseudomonas sp. A25(2017)]OOG83207.1 hypothetical protein B0E42_20440 [Pseudomonas sp. A25(2017)]